MIQAEFTSKETILVHGLYYAGAALMNGEYGKADYLCQNLSQFVTMHLSDTEIISLKAKMTKLGDDIPKEDLKTFDIEMRRET